MRQFRNSCGECRESLSLLAAGVLSDEERARAEQHAANCPDCRKYRDEIGNVAGLLVQWEQNFAGIEPTGETQARWRKDFEKAREGDSRGTMDLLRGIRDWCRDVVWPCRRIWAGFATVWLVLLGINLTQRDTAREEAKNSPRPSLAMVRAFLEGGGLSAEPSHPSEMPGANPPAPTLPPPRSERRRDDIQA